METFLKIVAADLYSRKSGNLGRTAVVFPNKRASLFFNEYLSQQSDAPLWSPAYISISELFRNLSPLETGDSISRQYPKRAARISSGVPGGVSKSL